MLFLSYLVENRMPGSSLCDMQISHEMVSNEHARQMTESL